MNKKYIVNLVYIINKKLTFVEIKFKTFDEANIWAYRKVLNDKEIVGSYIMHKGKMVSPYYLVGIVHLYQDIIRHPSFVPYDHEIFSGKYPKVLLVYGGYIIAPPKEAKLLVRY
ncbi:MAG: hypothetical protein R3Y43_01585 [Alphaproteobacteria bacterium]